VHLCQSFQRRRNLHRLSRTTTIKVACSDLSPVLAPLHRASASYYLSFALLTTAKDVKRREEKNKKKGGEKEAARLHERKRRKEKGGSQ
jgi:hypothetical protein